MVSGNNVIIIVLTIVAFFFLAAAVILVICLLRMRARRRKPLRTTLSLAGDDGQSFEDLVQKDSMTMFEPKSHSTQLSHSPSHEETMLRSTEAVTPLSTSLDAHGDLSTPTRAFGTLHMSYFSLYINNDFLFALWSLRLPLAEC